MDTDAEMLVEISRRLSMRDGEVAVLGLARSGIAAARLARQHGMHVYISDASDSGSVREAAMALAEMGIATQTGGHDLERIARAGFVVASPGIPPTAPPIVAARRAGTPVVSEVELGLRLSPGLRTIAVTGTNGKTTTTAMIGHLLRALGHDAADAGNIGTPVAELPLRKSPPSWAALELSSFQLHDTPGLEPDVGVLTTLSADHLDRYADVAEYYADKRRMFVNATSLSRWVVTADNADVDTMMKDVAGRIFRFSVHRTDVDACLDRGTNMLVVLGEPLASRDQLALSGDHNVANALAALLAVIVADPAHATVESRIRLADAIASFRALPHRLEPVADADGVLWLNDSKATNVSSTLVAVEGMTRPTILLLGGRHKGEPYTALIEPLRRIGKAVVAYGEATPLIVDDLESALDGAVPVHAMPGATFVEVIERVRSIVSSGDVVLLSPACSSYDMFNNYEERGRTFAQLARESA